MKQFLRIVLLLGVALLVSSGLVRAQDTPKTFCGDLAKEDCALLTESEAAMKALESHSFKLDATMALTGIPNMPTDKMSFHLTGSGALATDRKSMPDMTKLDPSSMMKDPKALFNLLGQALKYVSADVQFSLELPAEIRKMAGSAKLPETIKLGLKLVDGVIYVNKDILALVMPSGQKSPDWMGVNLPDLMTAMLKQPQFNMGMGNMSGMSSSMGMSANIVQMFSDPKNLGTFIKIERLPDAEVNGHKVAVFKTTLDYQAMFAMPAIADLMKQQMTAAGTKMSDKDIQAAMTMIQNMGNGMKFSSTQSIDLETKYVHQTAMSMVFDMSSLKAQMGSAFVMTMDASVTQADFNSVPAITAPKGGVVIPVESIIPSK